jgi:hypothetical protein
MALPVIIVDSATGSDATSSGAGPGDGTTSGSVLSGTTNASTNGTGLIVTLPAGTDLSNVLTDGSHVIFLNDSTAGARNFGKITASAGSGGATPTVTVANAFGLTLSSKSWAIGGKRASLGGSTTSYKLIENNAAAGDALPGWTIRFKSGHTESRAGRYNILCSGDTTTGFIYIEGESGAAVRPNLTSTAGDTAITCEPASYIWMRHFNVTASAQGVRNWNGTFNRFEDIYVSGGTGYAFRVLLSDKMWNCRAVGNSGDGVQMSGSAWGAIHVESCYFKNCGTYGIHILAGDGGSIIRDCIIEGGSSDGIHVDSFGGASEAGWLIDGCTIYNNAGDGIDVANNASNFKGASIINCIVAKNGGYGINVNAAGLVAMQTYNFVIRNCAYGTGTTVNASGTVSTAGIDDDSVTVDPQFVDPANGNFMIGPNLKALGFSSLSPIGGVLGVTRTFVDIGAAQRPENTGAAPNGWSGGVRPRAFAPGLAR